MTRSGCCSNGGGESEKSSPEERFDGFVYIFTVIMIMGVHDCLRPAHCV